MNRNILKNKLIIIIIAVTVFRFLISYRLPSFAISNLVYDDMLMVIRLNNLIKHQYFGTYTYVSIIKGIVYPFCLYFSYLTKISYSIMFTVIYISSCIYFTNSLKNIIKNKKALVIIYIILLFNPISYSSDLFQRLYRNTLSMPELLFFFGTVIRIMNNKDKKHLYYILGLIVSIMFLTKEENIWVIFTLVVLFITNIYKDLKLKNIILNLIPITIVFLSLNILSFINYKCYGIYTYNELSKSSFKDAYIKILKIKDDKKIDQVSIPKSTFLKLSKKSKKLNVTPKKLEKIYDILADKDGEITNGNMVWYFRNIVYTSNDIKDGKSADKYFKDLSKELDKLFENGTFKKEFAFNSVFLNVPTYSELKKIPISFLKAVKYTTTYKDIKTIPIEKAKRWSYDKKFKMYFFKYLDYHNTANITKNNPDGYELIRLIYALLTIILSIPAIIIYFSNIKKLDKLNLIIHIVVISYLVILLGVVYTHVTSFDAIRYCYLGNVYILQSIFIILNIIRYFNNKKGNLLIKK